MELKEIIETLFLHLRPFENVGSSLLFIGAFLCTVIQVSPIKVDPWDFLLGWVGDRFNSGINKRLHEVDKRINTIESAIDDHIKKCGDDDLEKTRQYIIDFVNDGVNGKRHTQEAFENCIRKCDKYEKYIEENKIANGVIRSSIYAVRTKYNEHLVNADFPEREMYINKDNKKST